MSDLQAALQTHRQAVDAFLVAARSVPSAAWNQPRAAGKWSPGQIAEHVMLAYEVNRGVLGGATRGRAVPAPFRPIVRFLLLRPVLRRGRFIPGSRAPKVFRPSALPPGRDVLIEKVQAAATAFERVAAVAQEKTIDHPIFGRLPVADFVRLQEIHTQHHRGQMTPAAG